MREKTKDNLVILFVSLFIFIGGLSAGYIIGSIRTANDIYESQPTAKEKCERVYNKFGSIETIDKCVNLLEVLDGK